ncbi:MAG TPA: penicillin acylase family protein [Pyrinomonadaceae bacterium]|nr:penicillin acylase family protein [Pyrinomonadaceae bacterium]
MKKQLLVASLLLSIFLAQTTPLASDARAQTQAASPAPGAKTLTLAGLRASVRIRRDERGIPHIEASNEADLYFAQGYATASDRLWQMDLLRRTARGELAEIFGRPALEEDKRRRIYGFAALSEVLVSRTSAPTRAALEAYARGVNAYIETRGGTDAPLPAEFQLIGYKPRPWRPADSLVIGKIFAETLSTTWPTDISRALLADLPHARRAQLLPDSSPLDVLVVDSDEARPQSPPENDRKPGAKPRPRKTGVTKPGATKTGAMKTGAIKTGAMKAGVTKFAVDVLPSFSERERVELLAEVERIEALTKSSLERAGLYMEGRAVSNNWVASGRRTASGKPLLANDPHLPATAPSIWHMAHLRAPGLHVAGVTVPGAPGIIIGHNEHVAWGMTNLDPDVQDLYLERFSPDKKSFYETPTGLREASVRREEIKVRRNLTDASTETVNFEVTTTRHGPIILEREGRRYALRWTALDAERTEFDAFYKINRARNWNEFRAALSEYSGPTQNFVYADTAGHIGYYGAGRVPLRRGGDGSVPSDGGTDAGEWVGFIPFDELPHVYDPPSGLIVTANSRVVGRSYPHHLTHDWAAPYRARRIYDLLSAKPKLTADDYRAVQADVYSIGGVSFAQAAAQLLAKLAPRVNASGQATLEDHKRGEAVTAFERWDGRVTAESSVAPLVAEMSIAFRRRILNAALGEARARSFRWGSYDLFFNRIVAEHPAEWLPKEFENYGELMRACLEDARAALRKRLGADETQWTWGRYSPARFQHPLAIVPLVGARFTIEPFPVNGSGRSAGATVNVGAGVSMRLIADVSDWDKTQQGIALGISGDPASPHWSDQLADWRAVTPRAFPFGAKAVAARTRETLVLAPPAK